MNSDQIFFVPEKKETRMEVRIRWREKEGQPRGCVVCAQTPAVGLMLSSCRFQFFIMIEQETLHFRFALTSKNDVSSSGEKPVCVCVCVRACVHTCECVAVCVHMPA